MASSSGNPYEGGGGVGGKIKRRVSRSAATPYARPPVAPAGAAAGRGAVGGAGGWIAKLVDPASRFIAGSASRLFTSVFKKGGPPALESAPVVNLTDSENTIHEVEEGEEELPPLITPVVSQSREVSAQIVSDSIMINEQRENNVPIMNERLPQKDERVTKREDKRPMDSVPTNNVMNISEIEQLLAQKTFTKEQFDRLTDLLRTRTVETELPKFTSAYKEKQETSLFPPTRQYPSESSKKQVMFSTPASTILIPKQEITSSPMELARAYMNSKSSTKQSSPSSALRLRTPIYTDRKPSMFLADVAHTSAKSSGSALALVPRQNTVNFSPGFDRSREAFGTPRSLGRTAISRMCRSPYVKAPGSSGSSFANKFSPYDTPGSTPPPGSKQVLKRGSAALYEEIGTVGPIRRIRQKMNMNGPPKDPAPSPYKNFTRTNPKTLTNTNQASTSSVQKRLENNDESDMRDEIQDEEMELRFNKAQARSSEMASKILDVVGKITKTPSPKRDVMQIEAAVSLDKEEREKVEKSDGKLVIKNNGGDLFGSGVSTKGKAVLDFVPAPKDMKPSFRMSVPEDMLDDDEDEDENTNTEIETTVLVKNVFNKVESSTSERSNLETKPVQESLPSPAEKVNPVQPAVISTPITEPETKKTALFPPASEPYKFTSDAKFQIPQTTSVESETKKDENTPPKAAAPLFGFGLKKEEKTETAASPFAWATTPNTDTGMSKPAGTDLDSERSSQKRKSEETTKLPETSFAPPAVTPSQSSSPLAFTFGSSTSPAPNLTNGSHVSPPKFLFSASSPAGTPSNEPDVKKLPVNLFASGSGFSTAGASKEFSSPATKEASFLFGANASAGTKTEQVPSDSGAKVAEPSVVKPIAFGTGTVSTAGTGSSDGTSSMTGTATFGLFSSTPVTFGSGTGTGAGTTVAATAETGTTGSGTATFAFGNTGSNTSTSPFGAASSQPATTNSLSQTSFNFGATNPNSNSSSSPFNFGSSTQNPSSNPSIASTTSSQLTFAFGAKLAQPEASQPAQAQSSGSQLSTPVTFGNNSTGFSFTSSAVSSTSSQLFGSGFGSTTSAPSTTPSVFGTTSFGTNTSGTGTSPSGASFGFGQSSSAPGSSFAFGAQPQSSSTFAFGSTNPNSGTGASTGFSLSNPNPGTAAGFGLSSANHSTGFGLSNPSSSTGFGLSNPNPGTGFGVSNPNPGTNNDQMSMEDSMVDSQAAKIPPVPAFGQTASPFSQPASPFGQTTSPFGQPASSPFGQSASPFGQTASPFGQQTGSFTFGATANQAAPPVFQPPGGEFNAGPGTFSQGSNAGEKGGGRKILKAGRKNRAVRK